MAAPFPEQAKSLVQLAAKSVSNQLCAANLATAPDLHTLVRPEPPTGPLDEGSTPHINGDTRADEAMPLEEKTRELVVAQCFDLKSAPQEHAAAKTHPKARQSRGSGLERHAIERGSDQYSSSRAIWRPG